MQRWHSPSSRCRLWRRLFVAARLRMRLTRAWLGALPLPLLPTSRPAEAAPVARPRPSSRPSLITRVEFPVLLRFRSDRFSLEKWVAGCEWARRMGLGAGATRLERTGRRATGWRSSKAILSAGIIVISVVARWRRRLFHRRPSSSLHANHHRRRRIPRPLPPPLPVPRPPASDFYPASRSCCCCGGRWWEWWRSARLASFLEATSLSTRGAVSQSTAPAAPLRLIILIIARGRITYARSAIN